MNLIYFLKGIPLSEIKFDLSVKLMSAVMEGFGLMGLHDDDFDSLFRAIKEHAEHRMPIGRVQFEDVYLNEDDRLCIKFALSPMILCSAECSYRGLNTVRWFIVLPDLDIDLSQMRIPELLAKSQLGLIETTSYDLQELAKFLDEEHLPFFR